MDLALFSLSQWYLLAIFIYIFLALSRKLGDTKPRKAVYISSFIASVVLSYLAAGRTGIGDTTSYIRFFLRTPDSLSEFMSSFVRQGEWGFNVFLFIVKLFVGDNPFAFLFICSIITLGGLNSFWKKESPYIELCMLVYIFGGSFVTGINGVRQAMVASVFIANYRLIRDKKYVPYIIMCLLLSTIHQSALVLLPMIIVLNFEPWKRGTWGLLTASIGMYVAYPLFASVVTQLLNGSDYDVYSNGILNSTNGGANILRVAVLLVPIILAYLFREELKEKYPDYGICLNGAILSFMFMFVASVRSWIFARFCIYFNPFSIVLLTQAIKCSGKNRVMIYIVCVLAYAIFFYFEMASTIYLVV